MEPKFRTDPSYEVETVRRIRCSDGYQYVVAPTADGTIVIGYQEEGRDQERFDFDPRCAKLLARAITDLANEMLGQ